MKVHARHILIMELRSGPETKNNNMSKTILLGHGSGGKLTGDLIKNTFLKHFDNPVLRELTDSANIRIKDKLIAFTTDSYVVDPIFFPGGDIGKLAICGTVNDLAVSGADPLFISTAFIIEEGFPAEDLERIVKSMEDEARKAVVIIVTGDTKVVSKGQCDRIFINTSGIGYLDKKYESISTGRNIKRGDKIIINGNLGDHGIAVMGARENLKFETEILSDCASLNHIIKAVLNSGAEVKFMRDITRGGLATVVCEIVENHKYGISIDEKTLPVRESVRGMCEIFGYDPLFMANEGKVLLIVSEESSQKALKAMRRHEHGKDAVIIGEVTSDSPGKAVLHSIVGGSRIIDKLTGEMLPRIC
jgi:hydrogenase expression/formation protein HypE